MFNMCLKVTKQNVFCLSFLFINHTFSQSADSKYSDSVSFHVEVFYTYCIYEIIFLNTGKSV